MLSSSINAVALTNVDSFKRIAYANGQCLLIRRDVYDSVGGHTRVGKIVAEDVALAYLVKGTGQRVRVAWGADLCAIRMYDSLPAVYRDSRLSARFHADAAALDALRGKAGTQLPARDALAAGLVTAAPDSLDWDDELRQAIETRTALSPDALSGMEANLRFGPHETLETRMFGRLSAWQNWIFIRPNAVGQTGALKVYGSGAPAKFEWKRV